MDDQECGDLATDSMTPELRQQFGHNLIGEELFDHLDDVVFFVKDRSATYQVVNDTLVKRCGVRSKSDLIGKTANQVLRAPLGERFTQQDKTLLKTGKPFKSQLELHVFGNREVGWCKTTKLPLVDTSKNIVGLVGVSQDLQLPDLRNDEYQHISQVIDHAESNIATPPRVEQLAKLANMSRYQLDRRMQCVFGLKTGQWLLKLRLDHAQQLLSDTDAPILQIALDTGYEDQSAFTRQFRKATGLTPREFREAQRRSGS